MSHSRFHPEHWRGAVLAACVDSKHRCLVAVVLLARLLTRRADEFARCAVHYERSDCNREWRSTRSHRANWSYDRIWHSPWTGDREIDGHLWQFYSPLEKEQESSLRRSSIIYRAELNQRNNWRVPPLTGCVPCRTPRWRCLAWLMWIIRSESLFCTDRSSSTIDPLDVWSSRRYCS